MSPPPKYLLFLILFTHTFSSLFRAESSSEDAVSDLDSPPRVELDQFCSRISILEKRISETVEELKNKDASIKRMDENIDEKSNYIALLNMQIEGLQKGFPEAGELKTKLHARSNELRNQADNLRKEIEAQINKKDALKVRIYTADKRSRELNLNLKSLQKVSADQETRISELKHHIQFAEEKLIKLKIEASLVSDEMNQALHVKTIVQEWADPQIKAIKKIWIPKIKKQWLMVMIYMEPSFNKFQDTADPYLQGIIQTYKKLMTSVVAHHMKMQDRVLELLEGHDYTRPFADKDIVWYMASAIFALPAILVVNLYTSIASNKPQKRRHKDHACRRAKRLRNEN